MLAHWQRIKRERRVLCSSSFAVAVRMVWVIRPRLRQYLLPHCMGCQQDIPHLLRFLNHQPSCLEYWAVSLCCCAAPPLRSVGQSYPFFVRRIGHTKSSGF